jgi:hypothetical protein
MKSKKSLYIVPVASTEFTQEAFLDCSGIRPTIRYSYQDEHGEVHSGIAFSAVSAIRCRSEACCSVWHIEDTYDALVEVEQSSWEEEVRRDVPDQLQIGWKARHFMIYLDSAGCFEFLAEAWEVLPEQSRQSE